MLTRTLLTARLTTIFILLALVPGTASALTARDKFHHAEAAYKILRNSPGKQKYRDQWLTCIDRFKAVYRHDPSGKWAAAGLFMAGKLYEELYAHSYRGADRDEAIDIFNRIIRRFPESRYKKKSIAEIQTLSTGQSSASKRNKASGTRKTPREKYGVAESCYRKLSNDPIKRKYRDQWLQCIDQYDAVYRHDPDGSWAAAGLFMVGKLYGELAGHSLNGADKLKAIDILHQVETNFPSSRYRSRARNEIRQLSGQMPSLSSGKAPGAGSADPPSDKMQAAGMAESEPSTKPSGTGECTVTGLRYWSNPNYTRIVIDADQEATFRHKLLKKDPAIQKPQRLYIDLENSHLGKNARKTIPINDNLLSDARAGQHTPESVRVVVDIKSFSTYKIFSLRNPFRIVLDVWGNDIADASVKWSTTTEASGKIPPSALARQLALGVRRIVIDAGHGGKDFGAPGYLKGVHEKQIVLKIAKRLKRKIQKRLGCEAIMTRDSDRYLTLEERTAIANTKNADLFISIHTNAAENHNAFGIETYYLNLATDDSEILVAARENATSTRNISDLQVILSDLMQNAKINESSRLAEYVQTELVGEMKKNYKHIKSKGVKKAPFYVLMGANMPAILVETSFISNKRECHRLTTSAYQEKLCQGIVDGIARYIKETNPTAFKSIRERSKG